MTAMKVLIADDDAVSRRLLEANIGKWGYVPINATDGQQAWDLLQLPEAPNLLILDWMMPGIGGIDICRKVRQAKKPDPAYIILLTGRTGNQNIVEGLEAGASDYITKPFDLEELRARVRCGERTVNLEIRLAERVRELEVALSQVKALQGLLPICSYCKKIRDDQDYWQRVEDYVGARTDAVFSHGICPECFDRIVETELKQTPSGEEG